MEWFYWFYLLILIVVGVTIGLLVVSYILAKVEFAEEWLKKFENGGTVISTKFGSGIILCVKPSTYSAYIEFESFSGWVSLNDLVPVSRHKNKW